MNCLPEDCLCNIISFIPCKKNSQIYLISKYFHINKYQKCYGSSFTPHDVKFKKMICCKYHDHDSEDKIHVINILNQTPIKNTSTIHFKSIKSRKIAEPYINLFGIFSHYCCNGLGIMYINNNSKDYINKLYTFNSFHYSDY